MKPMSQGRKAGLGLSGVLLLSMAVVPWAHAQVGDARVSSALNILKFKYSVTEAKNFTLVFDTTDKRTQLVIVDSHTEQYGKFEIREITSTAFKVAGALPAELANRLLADNERKKLGAWRIITDEGNTCVIFTAQIAADVDAESLRLTMQAVMNAAAAMEKETTGKDEY